MPDPFAAALVVLHSAAGSVAAVYTPVGGAPLPIRVIWSQGSVDAGGRSDQTVTDSNRFDAQRQDVAEPAVGDQIAVNDPLTGAARTFKVNGAAILDVEGLTWTCPTEELWSAPAQA